MLRLSAKRWRKADFIQGEDMFKKLLKLNFKVIFRSPIFYLIHAAVILGFLSYIVELPFNPVQDYT